MQKRRRFKQTTSLQDRLSKFVADTREKAEGMPDCKDRYELLKKVTQGEAAMDMEKWANSPELRPPK
jgi:hypothetical protein